jgi:hypothetical protein
MRALRVFDVKKSYHFLGGVDNAAFCQRVSDFLAEGYVLHGNPVMVMDNGDWIVGQAVILPDMVLDYQALKQDQSL